jgi:polyhydroxyalkanoate synthesis regulator phasin
VRIEASRDETRLVVEGIVNLTEQLKRTEERLDEKIDRTTAETQSMLRFSHVDLDRRMRTLEESVASLEDRVERLERSPH